MWEQAEGLLKLDVWQNKDEHTHTQSRGFYLQFAGPLVVAVDLQKVVYVYLHFWHLLLLQKTKANSVSELLEQRAALLSDKINQIKACSVTFGIFISHLRANFSLVCFPNISPDSAFIRLEMSLGQAAPAGAGQFCFPVVRGCFFGTAPLQRSCVPLVHLISPQGLCKKKKKEEGMQRGSSLFLPASSCCVSLQGITAEEKPTDVAAFFISHQ